MARPSSDNSFLVGPIGLIYARTALPIIFVMGMNGLLTITDAMFLGWFVGPTALAAVTLMFPVYMAIVAIATLVSSGMSSILARRLGGGQLVEAQQVFAGAHGLALALGALLIATFFLFGEGLTSIASRGSEELASMGYVYLAITIATCPLSFILAVNSDALRNEGRAQLMALMSLLVSVANIGLNYLFIAVLDLGVAGSAIGTATAQLTAFAIIVAFRSFGSTILRPSSLYHYGVGDSWREMVALGAPQSLSYFGVALSSMAIILMLQYVEVTSYDSTVTAYGIMTRVLTFTFLPLLGVSMAMQTITGNNFGSGQWERSNTSLKTAIILGFVYCALVQTILMLFPVQIGRLFVEDPVVLADLARIIPVVVCMFFLSGPLMMIATHFQSIGDAGRAAILSLSRTYLFSIPLTLTLPRFIGESGIWAAGPTAEVCALVLTALVLAQLSRSSSMRLGLFQEAREELA